MEERSLEEWEAARARIAAQEALLDTKIYAVEKDGFVPESTYDDNGRYAGRHRLSGLPVRKLSKEEAASDDFFYSTHRPGFIDGFWRMRKTKDTFKVTRSDGSVEEGKIFVEESGGARTSAFEVYRWWAKPDEDGHTVPMAPVASEQMTYPEDVDTPYDQVLMDPKPSGGRGYTITRHGKIPGPDPAFGHERESHTMSNGRRLPDVGVSSQDVMCECHHLAMNHEMIPDSKICWVPGCLCIAFKRVN